MTIKKIDTIGITLSIITIYVRYRTGVSGDNWGMEAAVYISWMAFGLLMAKESQIRYVFILEAGLFLVSIYFYLL